MRKSLRFVGNLLALFLMASLVACGGSDDSPASADAVAHDGTHLVDGQGSDGQVNEDVADGPWTRPADCPDLTGSRPARRSEHTGAFDAEGQRLVMFGGSFGVPENCGYPIPTFETETWIWDARCRSWRQSTATGPAGRARAASTWVPGVGLVVFGGRSRVGKSGAYTLHGDMWAYDPDDDIWFELSAKGPIAPRFNTTMVYAEDGNILVFGGNTSTSGMNYTANNDVWSFNVDSREWTQVPIEGSSPSKRFFAAATWDSKRKRMVIHGGADESLFSNTAKYRTDLWALTIEEGTGKWRKLVTPNALPDGRFWGGISYDAKGDRYIMFGGHDDKNLGNRNDLWAYDLAAGAWKLLRQADTYNKPPVDFCNFPPDFTNMDEDSPERRNGGVVAGGPGGLWVQGGKTDCGVIDDLFWYDYENDAWIEYTTATVGESCIRKGGVECTDYCL